MLGLPGESHAEMMATADEVARLELDSVKIHNLYVVRNTRLADQWQQGEVQLMELDEYVKTVVDFLERMPPHVVIERVLGDAPARSSRCAVLVSGQVGILAAVDREFQQRNTWHRVQRRHCHEACCVRARSTCSL